MNPLLRLSARREDGGPAEVARLAVPLGTPVELGRIDPAAQDRERLFVPLPRDGGLRLPIAPPGTSGVSRRQLRIEPLPHAAARITNLSGSIEVPCAGRAAIAPGATVELPLPTDLWIGAIAVTLAVDEGDAADAEAAETDVFQPLDSPVTRGDSVSIFQKRTVSSLLANVPPATVDALVSWWQNVIAVLQSASNSNDFFQKAAQAVVRLVGLDVGAVFLHENGAWRPAALETSGHRTARPSTTVLRRVLEEKRTFYSRVDPTAGVFTSIAAIDAYVAAPILDRDDAVIGAVYGHRSREIAAAAAAEITHLEALLVQTLASGVAAGLARMEHEKASLARKVQFEQFFSPELAAQLDAQPDLLAGRDAEVTVLFCDIRGFSGASERLGPAQTMNWVGGVLSTLSDQVAATGGVLVDYIGDEMMAMWGAPSAQPDHAVLACRTARLMLEHAGEIDARWQATIGAPTRFGIGINSAPARVGNTGSTRKFKYGPLGNGVNLASRVQGATKYLKVPAIVTGPTRRLLDDSFLTRRLCRVRVVNIVEPVDLFELDCGGEPANRERFAHYEDALAAFDAGEFSKAAKILGNLLAAFPGDGPSLVLLSRAVDCMIREPRDFSPVWELPGK
ncbi:MAG: adenylate/guanylate cyclase domain-containing protein [Planctomycetia bacterium]